MITTRRSIVSYLALSGIGWVVAYQLKKPAPRRSENIDSKEKAAAATLQPTPDPIRLQVEAFRTRMHELFAGARFAELETVAEEMRSQKALFGDGGWKLVEFYESLPPPATEPEHVWEKAEALHEDWLAAKPQSLTAHLACAEFLTSFAWKARGSGSAATVTEVGRRLFLERLTAGRDILKKARDLPGSDPVWWAQALRIGRGLSWPGANLDALAEEGHANAPDFWRSDIARANSLLPRWQGKPGDWEAYAEKAATRPDGLGAEVYARIVIFMLYYYDHVFRQSKASWPRTREGLEQLRKKYPDALELTSYAALLAAMAEDQATAQGMFAALGDAYLPKVWKKPERFVHCKNWAQTGKW